MPLTPAFDARVYKSRRDEVLRRMREMAPGPAVAIFPATPVATRNSDVEHPYRAHSDVYWLTGFEEPEAVVVLSTSGDKPFTLFVRPRDKEKEIWTGRRAGTEGAIKSFGADQAFEIGKLDDELPRLVGSARTLFYRVGGDDPQFDTRIAKLLHALRARARAGVNAPPRIEDPGQIVHELRLRKEARELDAVRKAVELTRKGHLACMKACRPGMHEYDLHGLLEREFRQGGGGGWGYYPVVAVGANATVLHYNDNNIQTRDGELALIAPGPASDLYTADVTRTFPASGRFSAVQRACYQLVLDAADACIAATRPGETIEGLHEKSVRIITEGMGKLGLLKGGADQLVKENAYRRLYHAPPSHMPHAD